MRKPPATATEPGRAVRVLSVSPIETDHQSLRRMFDDSDWAEQTGLPWTLSQSLTLESALSALQDDSISVVVCECDLLTGTWKDVLASLLRRPHGASLIVTSRLADDYLWAEALNLGAYDVLAKPFDGNEVMRVVGAAWRHWSNQRDLAAVPRVRQAASGA